MKIDFFCPHWGSEHLPFAAFLEKVKTAGYQGVEMSLPMEDTARNEVVNQLKGSGLRLIAQHWETVDADFETHKSNYKKRLLNLARGAPVFINSQTGKDYYTQAQNMELINMAEEVSATTGVAIVHETHRGKWSFAAHITQQYLQKFPQIRLAFDVSHWCNVAETYLHDQQEAVELAIKHTWHIHARVGHTEGPQVPDPRSPEWIDALNNHLQWWDTIIDLRRQQGVEKFTITPEFGAPPYTTLLPFTNTPIASQWEINVFMRQLLSPRYSS